MYKPGQTYGDALRFVSKRHNYYSFCLKYENRTDQNVVIPDNANRLPYLIYHLDKEALDPKEKFILPDLYNTYELAIMKLTIYVHNPNVNNHLIPFSYWRNIEKKEISCIVKIIKETENYYIIKLPEYYSINWGRGPTVPMLYALLQKNPRYIHPIDLEYSAFESIIVKYVKEFDNTRYSDYDEFKWDLYTPDTCSVCLETNSKIYCYCDGYHLAACEKCIEKLTQCPLCYKKIIGYDKVRHEL